MFTPAQQKIIDLLKASPGEPVPWDKIGGSESSVRTTMSTIRQILAAAGGKHGRVENVYGQGYRFVGGK